MKLFFYTFYTKEELIPHVICTLITFIKIIWQWWRWL